MGGQGARQRRDQARRLGKLTNLLDEYAVEWRSTYRTGFTLLFQFVIGRTCQGGFRDEEHHPSGFPYAHNFKHSVGVSEKFFDRKTKAGPKRLHQKKVWDEARALLQLLGSGGYVSSLENHCLNVNAFQKGHSVPAHIDDKDIGPQLTFSWNHSGSCLIRCWATANGEGELVDINTFHALWKFDGRLMHKVLVNEDFSGTRYSCVFFKLYDEEITASEPIFWPPVLLKTF